MERLTRERDEALTHTKTDPGACTIGDIHWIARMRNKLGELADQLEVAGREVARLTKLGNEVACALGVEGESDATVAHTAWEARGLIMAGVTVRTERDALRTERDALLAENVQLLAELAGARKTGAQRLDDALAAYKAAAPTGEGDGGP